MNLRLVAFAWGCVSVCSTCAAAFDPLPAVFVPSGNFGTPDNTVSATALADGRVLVCDSQMGEIFNPADYSWTLPLPMVDQQVLHAAVALPDGRVLIVGTGWWGVPGVHPSAELFDPATQTFSSTGPMQVPRYDTRAVLLKTGEVLVVGGRYDNQASTQAATAELYSPATGTFRLTGALGVARLQPTVTLLPSGQVLVAGGTDASNALLSSAEIYTPATGLFTPTAAPMIHTRTQHAAALLPNGLVLLSGGVSYYSPSMNEATASAELYDPQSNAFTPTGTMVQTRATHLMIPLPSGLVLVATGMDYRVAPEPTAEVYNPATGSFTFLQEARLQDGRHDAAAALLPGSKVLFAGGSNYYGYVPATAVFTPDRLFANGFD